MGLSFTHDGIGPLSQVDWDVVPGGSGTNSLAEYGWVGGLRQKRTVHYSVAASSKAESEFSYDAYNRLTKIEDEVWTSSSTHSQVSKFEYDYDVVHNLLKERYAKVGGSVGDRLAYDDFHRLSKAWMGVDSTTMAASSDPSGWASSGMHEHLTYGLDGVNNRTTDLRYTSAVPQSQVYNLQASSPQGPSNRYASVQPFGASTAVSYTYDNRGNLTFDGRFYYEYDFLNRLQTVKELVVPDTEDPEDPGDDMERFAVVDPQALEEAAREVNQAAPEALSRFPREHTDPTFRNRLRARVRGGVLRTRSSRATRSGGAEYGMPAWRLIDDAELQLVAVYGYDQWNRRVVTAVATTAEAGTWFHAFDGWRQVGQYGLHYASGYYAVPVKEFVWGSRLDELLSYRRRVVVSGTVSWETYYVLHGGQDTAAKLVSAAGVVVEQYEYDPYGRASVYVGASTTAVATSSVGLPFLWKAVRLDAETGLLYMRNRYYSTGLGRFLTRDPLGVWADAWNLGSEAGYAGCRVLVIGDAFGLQGQGIFVVLLNFGPSGNATNPSQSFTKTIEAELNKANVPSKTTTLPVNWRTAAGEMDAAIRDAKKNNPGKEIKVIAAGQSWSQSVCVLEMKGRNKRGPHPDDNKPTPNIPGKGGVPELNDPNKPEDQVNPAPGSAGKFAESTGLGKSDYAGGFLCDLVAFQLYEAGAGFFIHVPLFPAKGHDRDAVAKSVAKWLICLDWWLRATSEVLP